ncbi:MAG: hypothetical protein GEU26_18010 [Nitrososphaeraceae archaeon]|nr:hypothetical protein [Nitrososphaeraceae archaeon]
MRFTNNARKTSNLQNQNYENDYGSTNQRMSLFPEEDVLTREIETWRDYIDKLPSEEDKVVLTKLLNGCYKYAVAINSHAQLHPFPAESLIMSLLLSQHKLINQLKLIAHSKLVHEDQDKNVDKTSSDLS